MNPHVPSQPQEYQKPPVLELALLATALMLVGVFRMPYGFYTLLRFAVVCATGALFFSRRAHLDGWHWLYGSLSVLYNPVIPVHLGDRELWQVVNLVTAAAVWWGVWKVKGPRLMAER